MLEFFNSVFIKVATAVTSLIISVGLVAQPVPSTLPQIAEDNLSTNSTEAEVVIKNEKTNSQNEEVENLAQLNKQIENLKNTIQSLEAEIKEKEESSKTQTTNIVNVKNTINNKLEIFSVNTLIDSDSAKIEWQTNLPTESKIFLSGGGLLSKVFNSESGKSTRHIINTVGLFSNTTYSYEIEAIAGNDFVKKTGSFRTDKKFAISIISDKSALTPGSGFVKLTIKTQLINNYDANVQAIPKKDFHLVITRPNTVSKYIDSYTDDNGIFEYYILDAGNFPGTISAKATIKNDLEEIADSALINIEVKNLLPSSAAEPKCVGVCP